MNNTNLKNPVKNCLNCSKVLNGRSDKKFCSNQCRSELFNQVKKSKQSEDISIMIIKILQTNRRVLEEIIKNKRSCLTDENTIIIKGYNPVFHTHMIKDKGKEVIGCFEYGMVRCGQKKIKIVRADCNRD
jgi:predicted nucleic acid-binding Zn ribbon protein